MFRLKSVSRNPRHVSLRVVNLAHMGLDEQSKPIRLPDVEDGMRSDSHMDEVEDGDEEELPDLAERLPIRGRTLGFLGSISRVWMFLYRFLTATWTEPTILLLIVFNVVDPTIQAAR